MKPTNGTRMARATNLTDPKGDTITPVDRCILSSLHGSLTSFLTDPPRGTHPDTLFVLGLALSGLERDCREVEAMA
jgi:hypothetical protein